MPRPPVVNRKLRLFYTVSTDTRNRTSLRPSPQRPVTVWHDDHMAFTTRTPAPEDADAIADLHVTTWCEAYAHLIPDDYFSDAYVKGRHRMWEYVLTHPSDNVTIRVAESDGTIVGSAWAGSSSTDDEQPRSRQLYAIYVSTTHYVTRVGQTLLDETPGDSAATLWITRENPRATAFYIRNGFRFDDVEQIDRHAPAITDARMVR